MFNYTLLELLFIVSFTYLFTTLILKLLETESDRMEKRLGQLIRTTTSETKEIKEKESLFKRVYEMLTEAVSNFVSEQQRKGRLGSLDLKIKQSGKDLTTNEVWTRGFIYALIGFFIGLITKNTLLILALPALGIYLPINQLNGEIKKRQQEFLINLPNFLDLVAITLPSTNHIVKTFRIVCDEYDNIVSDEFRRLVSELDAGRHRRAYQDFVERVGLKEVESLINQIHQGEITGAGMQEIINVQARSIRAERKNFIIEKGNKAQLLIYLPAFLFLLIFMATILFPFASPIISEFFGAF